MSIDDAGRFVKSVTGRLALTYLAIIMLMSIAFSVVFYRTSSSELSRHLPTVAFYGDRLNPDIRQGVDQFLRNRIDEGRHELLLRLVLLNLLAFVAGGVLSYFMAIRTLKPVEDAMEAQSQFISDASHELRTPLTAIQTSNEVALRKPKLTLAEAKHTLAQNTEDVARLRQLTDGLLRLAKKDKVIALPKPISLQEVVAEAMNQIVPAAQAKKITVNDKVPNTKVLGDQQSLVQVVVNLLDNAIKYSESKATIVLNSSNKGRFAYLNIKDNGMGIRAADLPHIFKRFYRTDRSRSKEKRDGYGLGLSIADELVKQYNGEILVKSTPDEGSTFTIKLPLA